LGSAVEGLDQPLYVLKPPNWAHVPTIGVLGRYVRLKL
jgi:hypothetical protein